MSNHHQNTKAPSDAAVRAATSIAAASPWKCDGVSGNGLCIECEGGGRCQEVDRIATALEAYRAKPLQHFDPFRRDVHCSFCGKSNHEVDVMIAGPVIFICPECIDLCGEIVKASRAKKEG